MSFQLGDVVPLSVTVKDSNGQPANAGAVTLTVTLPDGTTAVTGSIGPTTTGVYDHDYATVQAGRHGVRWVATGANASAFTDAFDVEPADDGDFVSLADVKRHMNKTSAGDDAELAGFVSAACRMITERIGQVSPATVTDEVSVRWRRRRIVLDTHPVIEVSSVVVAGNPVTTIPAADADAGVTGWVLDSPGSAVLSHTGCWPAGTIRIIYRAGRTPIPGNVRLAALELAAHLWRSSEQNFGGGRPGLSGSDEVTMPGAAWALPIRVRELLGLGKNPTSDVMVG
jgi:hypothetical protein